MDKLSQLLSGNVMDFSATFGAATREWSDQAPPHDCPVWMEGWVAPAHAAYVMGDGEFIHEGQPRRFYFSGLPLRHCHRVRLSGTGNVLGLRRLRDFSGVYLPREGTPSRGGRGPKAQWENVNGVLISVIVSDEDCLAELPDGGLRVRLASNL
jgi:hypothetical protein